MYGKCACGSVTYEHLRVRKNVGMYVCIRVCIMCASTEIWSTRELGSAAYVVSCSVQAPCKPRASACKPRIFACKPLELR